MGRIAPQHCSPCTRCSPCTHGCCWPLSSLWVALFPQNPTNAIAQHPWVPFKHPRSGTPYSHHGGAERPLWHGGGCGAQCGMAQSFLRMPIPGSTAFLSVIISGPIPTGLWGGTGRTAPGALDEGASWESGSGIAEFWLNGRPWPRKGLQKGYEVGNEAVVMLGQEQDAYGGGFDVYNSFTGEMADVHLWDAGLSPDKMRSAYLALRMPPALLAWGRLRYEAKGDVVVKPRLREVLGA
uniref:Pentraxin family member n=1 Tax=Pavo cristatus TaxID=9049 RepID=A0A8C9ENC1_PAVCR